MKTQQHIGQDFTSQIKLNLIPWVKFQRGYYTLHIRYVTDQNGVTSLHHETHNIGPENLNVIVGRDVRDIEARFQCHNSFPQNPMIDVHFKLRLDRLILLNLAYRLLDI